MTENISNGSVDSSIHEISATIEQNETRKAKLPKLKFFITTIWSLILVVPQYVDIATDIILLIDYSSNEMWGYFVLTLIFILMPFLVSGIVMLNESFFAYVLVIPFTPFLLYES